jgi:hypothetical protein
MPLVAALITDYRQIPFSGSEFVAGKRRAGHTL